MLHTIVFALQFLRIWKAFSLPFFSFTLSAALDLDDGLPVDHALAWFDHHGQLIDTLLLSALPFLDLFGVSLPLLLSFDHFAQLFSFECDLITLTQL